MTRSVIVARARVVCVGRSVIQKNLTYFEIDDVPAPTSIKNQEIYSKIINEDMNQECANLNKRKNQEIETPIDSSQEYENKQKNIKNQYKN